MMAAVSLLAVVLSRCRHIEIVRHCLREGDRLDGRRGDAIHPNRSPLIPAEKVKSHMKSPGGDASAASWGAAGSVAPSSSSSRSSGSSGSRLEMRGASRLSISMQNEYLSTYRDRASNMVRHAGFRGWRC